MWKEVGERLENSITPPRIFGKKSWITCMEMKWGLEKVGKRSEAGETASVRQDTNSKQTKLTVAIILYIFTFRFQLWHTIRIQGFFWNLLFIEKKKIRVLNSHSHTIQNCGGPEKTPEEQKGWAISRPSSTGCGSFSPIFSRVNQ